MVGVAPDLCHAPLHVGVEALAGLETALRGEHRFRRLGRELAPRVGRAGLHDYRPALKSGARC